jgi:glycosyltransferase involved in cell wall biosynthesis
LHQIKNSMKIIYIYTAFTTKGGADRVIIGKANYLSEHGFDITIITDSQNGRKFAFPIAPNVKHIDLPIDFGKEYKYNLFFRGFLYFFLMKKYRRELTSAIIAEKPDIVISTMGRELDFLTSIKDNSIKIGEAHTTKDHLRSLHLMEQRGFPYNCIAKFWRKKMENNASKLNALVVLTKEDEKSWKSTVKNTFVINNSLPFYPSEISTCKNKQAIIVGRYNDAKGYTYLIDAWKTVYKTHPEWIINIYGSGEYKEAIKKKIKEYQLEKVMIMHEPTDDIMNKYLSSSIYVLSSKYEGFPMVLLEAMACGVPCVSFDCPYGPRNIINNGVDGILVEYLNSTKLAESICMMIEDEKRRKLIGANARKNVIKFSQENIMKQWVILFETLEKSKEEQKKN